MKTYEIMVGITVEAEDEDEARQMLHDVLYGSAELRTEQVYVDFIMEEPRLGACLDPTSDWD